MHLQHVPVLSDVSADNFDDAFDMFRPGKPSFSSNRMLLIVLQTTVIYGLADSSKMLTDAKVQEMMDICQSFFDPHVHEENVKAVRERYGDMIKMESPVLGREKIEKMAEGDEEGERVMKKFDALKILSDDVEATYMGRHPLLGFVANIERGQLGLKNTSSESSDVQVAKE